MPSTRRTQADRTHQEALGDRQPHGAIGDRDTELSEHGQDYTVVVLKPPRPDGQVMDRRRQVPVRCATFGPVTARNGLLQSAP